MARGIPPLLGLLGLLCLVPARGAADCPAGPHLPPNLRITIDVVNAPIDQVLFLIAEEADVSFILAEGVEGTVTLRLRDVPLEEALALILCSQGLGWEQYDNLLRIGPAPPRST